MIDPVSRGNVDDLRLRVQAFGFGRLSGSVPPAVLEDLQNEAEARFGTALRTEQYSGLQHRASIVSLGPQAKRFLSSEQMTGLLCLVFGEKFVLAEQRSCLTFYKEGDHLGPHLDEPADECAVTIIVCVNAVGPAHRSPQTGLLLRVYGPAMPADGAARLSIPTHTGAIVIGFGSKIWHERPMLQKGEQVAALTGCYRHATRGDVLACGSVPS